jgi:hypothetical protein
MASANGLGKKADFGWPIASSAAVNAPMSEDFSR